MSYQKLTTSYWNDKCEDLSNALCNNTNNKEYGSDLLSSMNLIVATTSNTWFSSVHICHLNSKSANLLFPSYISYPARFIDTEVTIVRSRKIRIYPKSLYISRIKSYLGISRYWYNKTIEYLKTKGTKASLYEARKIQKKEMEAGFENEQGHEVP